MTDEEMAEQRKQNLERVLNSDARRKVIVAGPGTGKTFTFKQVLEGVEGPALILSFLNNLVEDLQKDLGARAEVRTFHSFCRGLLHNMDVPGITRGVDYFPGFSTIVEADLALSHEDLPDRALERAYMYLDDSQGIASAGLSIGDYYNAVGHTDSVYRVHQALTARPELVPAYSQVLVDEYQDFSLLEASLIDELANASPLLIVGDDDQALYGFKHASADYLRDVVQRDDFVRFELPFCTRCTTVLVDATHRVVAKAQLRGLLSGRVDKQYICYLPEKREASERNPAIIHARCTVERNTAPYMCRYVAQQIGQIDPADIAESWESGHPTVLVVAPSQFARRIYRHLEEQQVANIELAMRPRLDIEILDGYGRLIRDENSRLGWRIVLHVIAPVWWADTVRQVLLDQTELRDALPDEFVTLHLRIVDLLRRLATGNELTAEEHERIEAATGLPVSAVRVRLRIDTEAPVETVADETQPRVVVTTLLGAKGLQAEHVFVVGLNAHHFPYDNAQPTEDEVCELLVALTRARKSCTLVSCQRFGNQQLAQSTFLTWLEPLLERVVVNAAYW